MTKITVGKLIKELSKLPKDKTVELSVNYDNCDHIQSLKRIYHNKDIDWIILSGKGVKHYD